MNRTTTNPSFRRTPYTSTTGQGPGRRTNWIPGLLAFLACATAPAVLAGKLDVGGEVPAFKLEDATGAKHMLGDDILRIYATASRDADGLMEKALKQSGQSTLDAQKAVVIADISEAPFFIKGFIRSDLEGRSYATWLDESGDTSRFFPHRPDRVLVIDLEKRRITAIRHASKLEQLMLELATTAPTEAVAPSDDGEKVEPEDEPQEPFDADL